MKQAAHNEFDANWSLAPQREKFYHNESELTLAQQQRHEERSRAILAGLRKQQVRPIIGAMGIVAAVMGAVNVVARFTGLW